MTILAVRTSTGPEAGGAHAPRFVSTIQRATGGDADENISGTSGVRNRIYRSLSAALALPAALALLTACAFPTLDQVTLKAIQAESRTLMVTHSGETVLDVPKSRWPRVIASLEPEFVMVYPDGVEILIKPDFDGGWGYHVPRNEREPPEPASRYWALSHGVYWFHPY